MFNTNTRPSAASGKLLIGIAFVVSAIVSSLAPVVVQDSHGSGVGITVVHADGVMGGGGGFCPDGPRPDPDLNSGGCNEPTATPTVTPTATPEP